MDVVEEDTVVTGRAVRTRLTGDDSVVEPDPAARRFRERSDGVVAISVAALERIIDPRVGGRDGTTLVFRKTLRVADCAQTGVEERRLVG